MRVLVATQHLEIVGGVETYLRAILPLLVGDGFEVAVLAENGEPTGGIMTKCTGVSMWKTARKSITEVVAEVERWSPDVVYTQGLMDSLLETALAERFPSVLFAHNYSGTCVSGTKCHSRPYYETCQRTLGLGCLAAYFPRGCGGRNPITMLRLYRAERRRQGNLNRYRAILVASRHMAEEFRRNGVKEDRLKLVPLFPPDQTPDHLPPTPRPRTNRILFVGRITPLKGLLHLIEALARANAELKRELVLVIAGDGPARAEAELASRSAGVSAEFLGWITPEQRNEQMRLADVLAVPSVWPEPFGLVGVEAGCVGLPAVGYASGGIPDWLIPGLSGESAPGNRPNPAELSMALVRALADDAHWHRLRIGAWETARRFTPGDHLGELSGILRAVSHTRSSFPAMGGT